MNFRKILITGLLVVGCLTSSYSQKIIDEVMAIVGGNIIMKSELESQYLQAVNQGFPNNMETRCLVTEDLLFQTLLLNQAQLDSIEVSDAQVDDDVDRKLQFFLAQMGGNPAALEAHFGKTYLEVKEDLREVSKNSIMARMMMESVSGTVEVTPEDVRKYFNNLHQDSVPLISAEVEVGHIVIKPKVNELEKLRVREQLVSIREELLKGASFKTKAILYSDDPGSGANGGELGFVGRGQLVPAFEAVAFNLKPGEISDIVESQYGFHVIELIERRGEMVNVRHILKSPKVYPTDVFAAKSQLDSIYNMIIKGKISFKAAASKFSEDENSAGNGGIIINPQTATSKFPLDDLDSKMFLGLEKLKPGEYSKPNMVSSKDGSSYYQVLFLKSRSEAHKATLKTDYHRIQQATLEAKKAIFMEEWVEEKINETHVFIKEFYLSCDDLNRWSKKQTN